MKSHRDREGEKQEGGGEGEEGKKKKLHNTEKNMLHVKRVDVVSLFSEIYLCSIDKQTHTYMKMHVYREGPGLFFKNLLLLKVSSKKVLKTQLWGE